MNRAIPSPIGTIPAADWLTVRGSATHFAPGEALRAGGLRPQTLVAAHVLVSARHAVR